MQEAGSDGLVHIGDVGTGVLLLRTDTPGLYIPAPATATDIETWVSGATARTKITQRFENPADGWVEGVYVFPMPQDSAVDTLRMQIGDRFIEGEIKERQEARRVYEAALKEGKKASLVEQERPNIFTNSVANIGPHEIVIVQIEYQEALPLRDGAFSMRVPLVVAPRYSPKPEATLVSYDGRNLTLGVSDPVPDRERLEAPVLKPEFGKLNPVKITVHLDAGFPLGDIKSETPRAQDRARRRWPRARHAQGRRDAGRSRLRLELRAQARRQALCGARPGRNERRELFPRPCRAAG